MAGSLKFFNYTADDGTNFALLRDESNVEAANAGGGIFVITAGVKYKLPSNVKPRRAIFIDSTGRIRREVPIMKAATYAAIDNTTTIVDQVSGATLNLKTKKGEEIQLPTLSDTGLNDGDDD